MSCVTGQDPQMLRLVEAIAAKVGPQRFHVWFNNSTKIDLKADALEISVANDFIGEWIGSHYTSPIQEAVQEVLGGPLRVRFSVVPQLFDAKAAAKSPSPMAQGEKLTKLPKPEESRIGQTVANKAKDEERSSMSARPSSTNYTSPSRLRHDLASYVVGPSNQLAFNAAIHVAQFPGSQYNPLFIHGVCGLGKTHLLQGICRKFIAQHPTKPWAYMTGEEFTNEFVTALRTFKIDQFRQRLRHLDLLVIDDVHFLSGKTQTQEEFLHTFNAIEAMGRQVVIASDNHPKLIEKFGESLINRFVSGMVVRIDSPNYQMRMEILRRLASRQHIAMPDEAIAWIARRVTQNVRELEGALTRVAACARLSALPVDEAMVQEALSDLDRMHVQPIRPETIVEIACDYFGVNHKDILSSRREHGISMPRSVAMFLVRKITQLSYPEIGHLLNKKNHSTVISACNRIDSAVKKNALLEWRHPLGSRKEEAGEVIQRLEELCRNGKPS